MKVVLVERGGGESGQLGWLGVWGGGTGKGREGGRKGGRMDVLVSAGAE